MADDVELIQVVPQIPTDLENSVKNDKQPQPNTIHKTITRNDGGDAFSGICQILAVYYGLGYYSGAKPFRWNHNTGLNEWVDQSWQKIWQIVNIMLVTISTTLQFVGLYLEYQGGTLRFESISTLYLIGAFIITGYCTVFQIHQKIHAYEVKSFANLAFTYLWLMSSDGTIKNAKKFDRDSTTWMVFMLVTSALPIPYSILAYWFDCDFHLLSKTLPTCAVIQDGINGTVIGKEHQSFGWIAFYSMLVVYINIQHISSALCYIGTITLAIMGCRLVLDLMENQNEAKLQNPSRFILYYRALQMLFTRVNLTFGTFIIPFMLGVVAIFVISVNFALATREFSPLMAYGLFVNVSFMSFSLLGMDQAAVFADRSDQIIRKRTNESKRSQIGVKKSLKTCTSLRVKVGDFFEFSKATQFEFISFILDQTINLMIEASEI